MVAQLDRATVSAGPGRAAARLVSYALFEGRPATTRGRWINSAVRANLALGRRLGRGRVDRPITVVGIGRSGTTLLGRLLGVHSHVGFLNEPKAMWHEIVPDEDIIGSYGPEPVRLHLDAGDATPAVVRRAHALFSWHQTATRSRRVVDKYPELVYRAGFVRSIFPDGHLVAIVRRPWDVVTSIDAWGREKATDDADWWGVDDRKWRVLWNQEVAARPHWAAIVDAVDPSSASPVERAAVEWIVGTSAALALPDELDRNVHVVRYGDLVADPRRFLADLLTACELPVEERVLSLAADAVARTRPPAEPPTDLPDALVALADDVAERAGLR